jgi:hypothetical protein
MSTSLTSAEPIPTSTTPSSIPHDIARKYVYSGAAFEVLTVTSSFSRTAPIVRPSLFRA